MQGRLSAAGPQEGDRQLKPDDATVMALAAALNIEPLGARVLVERGVTTKAGWRLWAEEAAPLSDPERLPDLPKACDILRRSTRQGDLIRVFGDYDADGVTATALLVRALGALGARVDWQVPNRFDEGYGLSTDAVRLAARDRVDVLVTVDCGSSSPEAAEAAARAGVTLIITDHHRLPAVWPEAACLVTPERLAVKPILSGAGVALQLARALLEDAVPPACWALAAVGSVADVMPMVGDTRAIVRRGLSALNAGACAGLSALAEVAGRDPGHLTAEDVSFALAPRLNAAGRMGSPEPAVALGLADARAEAVRAAGELENANRMRRAEGEKVTRAVLARLEADAATDDGAFLVAAGEAWHEGVIGIAAARASELLDRPVAVIALHGDQGKGSVRAGGRGDVLGALRAHEGRFLRLGGHFGAAGFTILRTEVDGLAARLSSTWEQYRTDEPAQVEPLPAAPADLTPALGRFLDTLEPYGMGWPRPLFRVVGEVESVTPMGSAGQHARIRLTGCPLEGVRFGLGSVAAGLSSRRLAGVVQVRPHWWRGRQRYQLYWERIETPPPFAGPLHLHPWYVDEPPSQGGGVVAGCGRLRLNRVRNLLGEGWTICDWERADEPRPGRRPWRRAYVIDPPPHRPALEALVAGLAAEGCVYWAPEALDAQRAQRQWERRVPDRERLLRLWRARRAGHSPLVPGRKILSELGVADKPASGARRSLAESVSYRTAWRERDMGEQDWERGGPWRWREEASEHGVAEQS